MLLGGKKKKPGNFGRLHESSEVFGGLKGLEAPGPDPREGLSGETEVCRHV